jgi:outer membrane receptor for Fe3+-dicitrate
LVSAVTPRIDGTQGPTTNQVSAETSTQAELGLRVSLRRRFDLESTVFGAIYRNQVVPAGGGDGQIEVDGGATRRRGLEVAAVFTALRSSSRNLTFRGRYTALAATFAGGADQGRTLPYAPAHSGGLVTTFAAESQGIRGLASFATSLTGAQFTDPANTIEPDVTGRVGRVPPRAVFDATVEATHRRSGWALRLIVKNLFDDVQVIARRPDGVFPGAGRLVLLGLRYTASAEPEPRS